MIIFPWLINKLILTNHDYFVNTNIVKLCIYDRAAKTKDDIIAIDKLDTSVSNEALTLNLQIFKKIKIVVMNIHEDVNSISKNLFVKYNRYAINKITNVNDIHSKPVNSRLVNNVYANNKITQIKIKAINIIIIFPS